MSARPVPVVDRIFSRLRYPENGCWEYPAAPNRYGYISWNGRDISTHRVVYLLLVGPTPDGLELDHLCRNRCCCNPAHLEPVTHAENIRRGWPPGFFERRSAAITHCKHGHEFTPENTRIDKRGARCCRACARVHSLRHYCAKKEAA